MLDLGTIRVKVKKMSDEINIKDTIIPLHIISLSGKMLKGRTRLQKLVFLSQQMAKGKFDYDFEPAPYGPLSFKLNHTLERMKKMGLINEDVEYTYSRNKVICYSLTKEGKELLDFGISKFMDSEITTANQSVFSEYGDMPFVDLLDYVHMKYPEFVA